MKFLMMALTVFTLNASAASYHCNINLNTESGDHNTEADIQVTKESKKENPTQVLLPGGLKANVSIEEQDSGESSVDQFWKGKIAVNLAISKKNNTPIGSVSTYVKELGDAFSLGTMIDIKERSNGNGYTNISLFCK